MAALRRSARFSDREMEIFFEIIKTHRGTIESKKIDATSIQKKSDVWALVTYEFNSNPMVTKRTVAQIKKRWENLKARIKREKSFEIRNRALDSNDGMPEENGNLVPKLEMHDSVVVKKEKDVANEEIPLNDNLESRVSNTPSNETLPETTHELSSDRQDPHNTLDANNPQPGDTQQASADRSENSSALQIERSLRVQKLEREIAMMVELHQLNVQAANFNLRKAEAEAAIAELTLRRLEESV